MLGLLPLSYDIFPVGDGLLDRGDKVRRREPYAAPDQKRHNRLSRLVNRHIIVLL